MTFQTRITQAPVGLDADELAEIAREEYEADLRERAWEAVAEAAAWNRNVQSGEWSLGDWIDYSGQRLEDYYPRPAMSYVPAGAGL